MSKHRRRQFRLPQESVQTVKVDDLSATNAVFAIEPTQPKVIEPTKGSTLYPTSEPSLELTSEPTLEPTIETVEPPTAPPVDIDGDFRPTSPRRFERAAGYPQLVEFFAFW